jgi:enterochelin esterase family protein
MPARFMPLISAAALAVMAAALCAAQNNPISPKQLQAALAEKPTGAAAAALADRIRATLGAENLKNGTGAPRTEDTLIMWALETKEGAPRVAQVGNIRSWDLTRLGDTDVYAAVEFLPNFALTTYQYEVGGKRFGGGTAQIEYYPAHPDSLTRPEVPKGKVTQGVWKSSVFSGTTRDYWVYVPAQYAPDKPAAVMVFQDGGGYLNAATIFDNLIAKGDMPVTVGIFINPGKFDDGRSNRSFEYDTLSDQYARFLRDEILPEVSKNVKLTDNPERRAICGASSGGICAWTVAWQMPDLFRKVVSHVGSFTDIAAGKTLVEGGHNYPSLIRKTPNKPIRVFLQDGSNDLDNEHGNWPLANQEMAAALRFKGYDYRFDFGQGFHSQKHGNAVLPDTLRWLWRDLR